MTKRIDYTTVMRIQRWLDSKGKHVKGRDLARAFGLTDTISYRIMHAYLNAKSPIEPRQN